MSVYCAHCNIVVAPYSPEKVEIHGKTYHKRCAEFKAEQKREPKVRLESVWAGKGAIGGQPIM